MKSFDEIKNFLELHYKEDRFKNTKDYKDRELCKTYDVIQELKIYGYSVITHHSTKTNETITFNDNLEIIKRTKGRTLNISYLI